MIPRDHPGWIDLRDKVLKPRIEELRDQLESPLLTAEQTAAIRGEIAANRRLISTIEPPTHDGAGPRSYS